MLFGADYSAKMYFMYKAPLWHIFTVKIFQKSLYISWRIICTRFIYEMYRYNLGHILFNNFIRYDKKKVFPLFVLLLANCEGQYKDRITPECRKRLTYSPWKRMETPIPYCPRVLDYGLNFFLREDPWTIRGQRNDDDLICIYVICVYLSIHLTY